MRCGESRQLVFVALVLRTVVDTVCVCVLVLLSISLGRLVVHRDRLEALDRGQYVSVTVHRA